ncbi:MAG: tellurite resistance protein [Moritella sp.]|uniref:tellurite resistance protein n=1 Tax=Moritella sp. TaxID=78556 RepID=UPI0029B1363E|nr:tellurite resistance protein [Moritella sp.]MDX2322143.1 tellurite resistance protein [Moritella sp.]
MAASALLQQYSRLFQTSGKPVLDLACGAGRNGLYLQQQQIPTIFADQKPTVLTSLAAMPGISAEQCWQVDFENGQQQLQPNSYQGIVVFRYLHRPLIDDIKQAVCAGGIVIYETFTVENRQFGRPNRDAFLLQLGELKEMFSDWECLYYFEGIKHNPDCAIAQIVCKKP